MDTPPPSLYHGYRRHDLTCSGAAAILVEPRQPATQRRWIWRMEFFDAFPALDLALLARGWWLAYIGVGNTFGCPAALRTLDAFYAWMTAEQGFHHRPVLEGLSRGGLYAYNWAIAHPDVVGLLFADNPVCDFRSWPGGKGSGPGSPENWSELQRCYGFASDAEAMAWPGHPVDNLAPLVAAGVPLLHSFGDADEVVPWEENTAVVAARVAALGGSMTLLRKPGGRHHPHGPPDSEACADWIIANART
ncbi:MAG: alpha/beta hydrolase [Planctomycetes bacterium]|nr:alpha/beta hydrolase [Planctomycetota bacterium]